MQLNAFWFYGYLAHHLGETKLEPETFRPKFHWRNQVHASPFMACMNLSSELREFDTWDQAIVCIMHGQPAIGVRIDADIGSLNALPDKDVLERFKDKLIKRLEEVGFSNLPEPKIYFMVELDDF